VVALGSGGSEDRAPKFKLWDGKKEGRAASIVVSPAQFYDLLVASPPPSC
jgi:hypothetical protein